MRYSVMELLGNIVPAGSANGVLVQVKMIRQIATQHPSGTAFLDFAGVDHASSSFLREAVLGFRDYCRSNKPGLYTAVANACELVQEDLLEVLTSKRDAVVVCNLDRKNKPRDARILGVLDQVQLATLDAVAELGETDAATLAERDTGPNSIGATGWNNRLAALAEKGLLVEIRRGRGKKYRALLKELEHGS